MLLRDDEALQAELFGHHRPGLGVIAGLGLHELTDGSLRRVVLEKLADELPQLFLFLAECEVHVDTPCLLLAGGFWPVGFRSAACGQ